MFPQYPLHPHPPIAHLRPPCPRPRGLPSPRCPAQVFEHPQWDLRAVRNDVALLKLAAPARLSAAVAPVCLPSADTSFPTGSLCAVTGWGKTRYNGECPREPLRTQTPSVLPAKS